MSETNLTKDALLARDLSARAAALQEGVPIDTACFKVNDVLAELPQKLPPQLRLYPGTEHSGYERIEALVRYYLPGWGWRTCQCHLSTDAMLFPDYNDPAHGERLKRRYPPERWENRGEVDLDIRPPVSTAAALLAAFLVTLATILQDRTEAEHG